MIELFGKSWTELAEIVMLPAVLQPLEDRINVKLLIDSATPLRPTTEPTCTDWPLAWARVSEPRLKPSWRITKLLMVPGASPCRLAATTRAFAMVAMV